MPQSNFHTYFDLEWGMFIGAFNENRTHQHYAVQLSIAIEEEIEIVDGDSRSLTGDSILIKSNMNHQLNCQSNHLLFLFNPISQIGHFLQKNENSDISIFEHSVVKKLKELGLNFIDEKLSYQAFCEEVKSLIFNFDCECKDNLHISDDRISESLLYLEKNKNRVVPLAEIADFSCMSASRFLHLFKQKTNITYRRAQLWFRVSKSLPYLSAKSITEVAHQFGFTDSAHYSKTFKQNFGFTPKFLSKT